MVKNLKQHIGNFFLLLAGIIFSIHIVVPHHHHNEQICIGGSYCHSGIFPNHQNSASHDNQHNGCKTNSCGLQQSYTLLVFSGRSNLECDLNSSDNHLPGYLYAIIVNTEEKQVHSEFIANIPPGISLPRYEFISSSFGLRAPPAV